MTYELSPLLPLGKAGPVRRLPPALSHARGCGQPEVRDATGAGSMPTPRVALPERPPGPGGRLNDDTDIPYRLYVPHESTGHPSPCTQADAASTTRA